MKTRITRSRKAAAISSSRWAAYATAGAATALIPLNTAEADIHYSGLINQPVNDPAPGQPASRPYFQLDQPGNSINPFHYRFPSPNSAVGVAYFFVYGNAPAIAAYTPPNYPYSAYGPYASKLSFGQAISIQHFVAGSPGARGLLARGSGLSYDQWLDPGIGFVGFRFDNGAGPQYGWARLDMDGAPGNSFTLIDYAWGDVGDSIFAGQVPEPGSLALLALGGFGLLAWRRQRAKAAAQQ